MMRGVKSNAGYTDSANNENMLHDFSQTLSNETSASINLCYNRTISSQSDIHGLNVYTKRRSICYSNSQYLDELNIGKLDSKESAVYMEAVLPNVRKFFNLLTSLNLGTSSKRYNQSKRSNECSIYFKFSLNDMIIHHCSESKSLYTCVILKADQFLKYNIVNKNNTENPNIEFTIDLYSILTSLIMFPANSSLKLCYDSDNGMLILEEIAFKRINKNTGDRQCITCKIKTLQNNPFDMPIDIIQIALKYHSNELDNIDNMSIYSHYLYRCLYDITSDLSDGKLVFAFLPNDESLGSVLVMAKSQPTISTQWNFRMDYDIFEKFNIKSKHEYYYSIRSWAQIARGVKNSSLVDIHIQPNGVLLLEIQGHDLSNKKNAEMDTSTYKIYYYLHPIT